MALFRLHLRTISRGRGESAVAVAAYLSGDRLHLDREQTIFNFGWRHDVYRSQLVGNWGRSRSDLWNGAEDADPKIVSITAREVLVALPHELDPHVNFGLALRFARFIHGMHGVAADVSLHLPNPGGRGDQRNIHAHLLITARDFGPDGFGARTVFDDRFDLGPSAVEHLRETWARFVNQALSHARRPERVDSRSYARQGIDRVPGRHLGRGLTALERAGIPTRIGDVNRSTAWVNRLLDFLGPEEVDGLAIQLQGLTKEQVVQVADALSDRIGETIRRRRRRLGGSLPHVDLTEADAFLREGQELFRMNRDRFFDLLRAARESKAPRRGRGGPDLGL